MGDQDLFNKPSPLNQWLSSFESILAQPQPNFNKTYMSVGYNRIKSYEDSARGLMIYRIYVQLQGKFQLSKKLLASSSSFKHGIPKNA
jgi:hypothetical protein